eukprot:5767586-Prymnesium_polylepis.1
MYRRARPSLASARLCTVTPSLGPEPTARRALRLARPTREGAGSCPWRTRHRPACVICQAGHRPRRGSTCRWSR